MLLLSDHVDAFWPEQLARFEEKPLRSVTQGDIDLSKVGGGEGAETAEASTETAALLTALKELLKSDVADVRATSRLVDSAVVLTASSAGPDLQMQRLMRRAGRAYGSGLPVLEINPGHALIRKLVERQAAGDDLADSAGTLIDLARIQDGDTPRDPVDFARRIASVLAG